MSTKFGAEVNGLYPVLEELAQLLNAFKALPDVDDVGLKFRGKFLVEEGEELLATVDIVETGGVWKTIIYPKNAGNDGRQGLIFDAEVESDEDRAAYFAEMLPILEQTLAWCADWQSEAPMAFALPNVSDFAIATERVYWGIWFARLYEWRLHRKNSNEDSHPFEEKFELHTPSHNALASAFETMVDAFDGYRPTVFTPNSPVHYN